MESTLDIVYSVLRDNDGQFLSVREIRGLIFHEHFTTMNFETIVKNIDRLKRLGHTVEETTERRGKLKLPVKIFRLKPKTETE